MATYEKIFSPSCLADAESICFPDADSESFWKEKEKKNRPSVSLWESI